MKKIINKPIDSKNDNLICKKCQSNCHKNCNCNFTIFSKWFCRMISFNGICKICKHSLDDHIKEKKIFIQNEEKEQLIYNDFEDLKNYIKYLSDKKNDEINHLDAINTDNNVLVKALNICDNQINNCNKEIEKAKNQNKLIENELIETVNNIKNNIEFLEKYALNKEKRTIKTFFEEYAKNKNNQEKKIIENLYKLFID